MRISFTKIVFFLSEAFLIFSAIMVGAFIRFGFDPENYHHLLGLDHQRLTYRYAGRDFRLTDVAGRVVSEILA